MSRVPRSDACNNRYEGKREGEVKEGLVKCHRHNVEYQEVETDYEYQGIIVRGVKALRCPVDGEEIYTLEQAEEIRRRLSAFLKPLKLRRRISSAGRRPVVYLPEEVMSHVKVKVGDEVRIYTEGKRIILEPAEEPEEKVGGKVAEKRSVSR